MFYFRTSPFYTTALAEISQFRKVAEFRHKLETLGVLYWTYENSLEFERNVREHLVRQIMAISEASGRSGKTAPRPSPGEARTELSAKGLSVFLSYSHRDKDAVRSLYHSLRAAGFRAWFDEADLVPGQLWHMEVDHAIRRADVILLVLSAQSDLDSGFVAREIDLIMRREDNREAPIVIPVRLDPSEPPAKLRDLQWVDYFVADGMERLVAAIERAWEARQGRQR